jgi:hypothetical protein
VRLISGSSLMCAQKPGLQSFQNCPFSALLSSNPNHFDEIFHEDLPIVPSVGPSALCFIAAIAIFAPWLAQ